ncbi:type II toxin-antitoxin system PemK/MazF family toxin [Mammaliicoccus sciuri]|uniref:type II toxin-antitoxin system PemK/MazF family toxin n=1 Tax=Mammaliicoccus sciuri TaxID=1296 RepID=UPI0034DD95C4
MNKNVNYANSSLNKSNKNLKDAYEKCNPQNKKILYMPHWLDFYANTIKSESQKKKLYFKSYKKGSIIYVKLGSNIGSEFSGNHFCVVLDNQDNKGKETITIVPLSSKSNENYIQLDTIIFDLTVEKLRDRVIKHKEIMFEILDKYGGKVENNELKEEDSMILTNINKEISEITTLINIYNKHKNKKSYANVSALTTISKRRVSKINNSDPTGNIFVSQNDIKKIHEQISIKFLQND